jgi:hypothetical protein
MRMGPFYDIYCLVENDFIVDTDDNHTSCSTPRRTTRCPTVR